MRLQEKLAAAKAAANAKALDTFLACTDSTSMPKDQTRTKMMKKLEEYQARCVNKRYDNNSQSRYVKEEDISSSEGQLSVTHSADYHEEHVSKDPVSSLKKQHETRPISNLQASKSVHIPSSEQARSICQQDTVTTHQDPGQSNLENIATQAQSSTAAVTSGVRNSSTSEKQMYVSYFSGNYIGPLTLHSDHHVQTPEAPGLLFHRSLAKLCSSHKRKRTDSTECSDHSTPKKRFK